MKESYRQIALGSANFIEKVKEEMEDLGRRREIPSTRFLSEYDAETIIIQMMQVLHIERKEIVEIGELFQMDYSAVSQAVKRFGQKSDVNPVIKEVMQKEGRLGVRLHKFTK